MTALYSNSSLWRRAARLAAFVMIFSAWMLVARAGEPYALFQNSSIVASGNTITATQVPVVLSSGATDYVNLTIQFDVSASGKLTVSAGYPQDFASPSLLASSFTAGTYVGPSAILTGKAEITVSGPAVTAGGATLWSLTTPTGASVYTYPDTATWYVGPIENSPYAARLKSAGITSTAWSYGLGSAVGQGSTWPVNGLIGVSQIGNTITFASFTSNGKDSNLPYDQITYTLKP